MVVSISTRAFNAGLKRIRDVGTDSYILPEQFKFKREDMDEFLRILKAEKPEDIKDIPLDRVVFFIENVYAFSRCLSFDSLDAESLYKALIPKRSVKTTKRRVL